MERLNKFTVCIFLLFLLITTIVPVSAVSVSFVDSAYLEQNDYTITDNYGTTVANFTGDSTVTLNGGKSYSIEIQPRGLFEFTEHQPGTLPYPIEVIGFFQANLAGLVCLFAIMLVAVKWRGHS